MGNNCKCVVRSGSAHTGGELYTTYGLVTSPHPCHGTLLSGVLARPLTTSSPLEYSLFPGEVSNTGDTPPLSRSPTPEPAVLRARIIYFRPRGKKRKIAGVTGSPSAAKKNKRRKKQKKYPEEPAERAAPKKVVGTPNRLEDGRRL